MREHIVYLEKESFMKDKILWVLIFFLSPILFGDTVLFLRLPHCYKNREAKVILTAEILKKLSQEGLLNCNCMGKFADNAKALLDLELSYDYDLDGIFRKKRYEMHLFEYWEIPKKKMTKQAQARASADSLVGLSLSTASSTRFEGDIGGGVLAENDVFVIDTTKTNINHPDLEYLKGYKPVKLQKDNVMFEPSETIKCGIEM